MTDISEDEWMKKLPVVLCRERQVGWSKKNEVIKVWEFWCPFCKREHQHSAGEGHRLAHCHKSDFEFGGFPHGYILKLDKGKKR